MHERKHSERLGLYEVRERGSKVRDITGLYEYENTLVTLELTGQQKLWTKSISAFPAKTLTCP